jgi:hypothetical protein
MEFLTNMDIPSEKDRSSNNIFNSIILGVMLTIFLASMPVIYFIKMIVLICKLIIVPYLKPAIKFNNK